MYVEFVADFPNHPNRIGQCRTRKNDYSRVQIAKDYFEVSDEIEREALMLHELGHCILYKGHNNSELSDACPASILNKNVPVAACLGAHWEEYLDELF